MAIRVGIDVGDRSVGAAAVEYDDDGWPIRILSAVSHIHDGGMDPDTAKSPQSRLATTGVARRTRRLTRRRRRRLPTTRRSQLRAFPVQRARRSRRRRARSRQRAIRVTRGLGAWASGSAPYGFPSATNWSAKMALRVSVSRRAPKFMLAQPWKH